MSTYRFTNSNASARNPVNTVSCYIDGDLAFRLVVPSMWGLNYIKEHDGKYRQEFVDNCRRARVPEYIISIVLNGGRPVTISAAE